MADIEKAIKGLECCYTDNELTCNECPYFGDECFDCFNILAIDVISLLKAQEPRVLTLEEIKDYDKPVWIDEKRLGGWKLPFFKFDLGIYAIFGHECYLIENYGKEWLPWTSHPTEEQRKKVKWE